MNRLFKGLWPNTGMYYTARVQEAQRWAANAVRDEDRRFWLNIAQCWLNLSLAER